MFCPNCGAEQQNTSKFCAKCGNALNAKAAQPAPSSPQAAAPESHAKYMMANRILVGVSLICGGGILGAIPAIIGIIMATQANTAYNAGDYATANAKIRTAKIMMILSIIIIILSLITAVVLLCVFGTASIVAAVTGEMNFLLAL